MKRDIEKWRSALVEMINMMLNSWEKLFFQYVKYHFLQFIIKSKIDLRQRQEKRMKRMSQTFQSVSSISTSVYQNFNQWLEKRSFTLETKSHIYLFPCLDPLYLLIFLQGACTFNAYLELVCVLKQSHFFPTHISVISLRIMNY